MKRKSWNQNKNGFHFHFYKSDTKFCIGFEKYSDAHPLKMKSKNWIQNKNIRQNISQIFGQPAPEGRFSPPLGERFS
jgi:hypothetical protein